MMTRQLGSQITLGIEEVQQETAGLNVFVCVVAWPLKEVRLK